MERAAVGDKPDNCPISLCAEVVTYVVCFALSASLAALDAFLPILYDLASFVPLVALNSLIDFIALIDFMLFTPFNAFRPVNEPMPATALIKYVTEMVETTAIMLSHCSLKNLRMFFVLIKITTSSITKNHNI